MKIKLGQFVKTKVKVKDGLLLDPDTNEPLDMNYYDMNEVWKAIGLKLSQYYNGQTDPIYAVSCALKTGNLFHDEPRIYYQAKLNLPRKLGNKYWKALPPQIRVAAITQFWADDIKEYGAEQIKNDILRTALSFGLFIKWHTKQNKANDIVCTQAFCTYAGVIVEHNVQMYDGKKTWYADPWAIGEIYK